uniref:Uncharacterized protein n=1 Tax=Oncorhynchus kisutch TaxID=8019 RepID=A0A8C7LDC6_ONCKI
TNVHDRSVSLFLDGLEEDGTPFDTRPLTLPISEIRTDIAMRCHCPLCHPRVHPLVGRYFIPNAVEDTANNSVLSLNLDAQPVSYTNDQDMVTPWVSNILTGQEDIDQGLTITIDLVNGQYQVTVCVCVCVSVVGRAVYLW